MATEVEAVHLDDLAATAPGIRHRERIEESQIGLSQRMRSV
jgi:hypothetical protein